MISIGDIFNSKYRVEDIIHSGDNSSVFRVTDINDGKTYALKTGRTSQMDEDNLVSNNLLQEAEILKKFNCPGVVKIYEVIEDCNNFFLVMEYIQGKNLLDVVNERGVLSQTEALRVAFQITEILCRLHGNNPVVIYQDLKPSNLMLREDGTVVLVDFGIATERSLIDEPGRIFYGTEGFAAPEQYGGGAHPDERSDIFGLGATFNFLITGEIPEHNGKCTLKEEKVSFVSDDIIAFINKCIQINPDDRIQSAVNARNILKKILGRIRLNSNLGIFSGVAFLGCLVAMIICRFTLIVIPGIAFLGFCVFLLIRMVRTRKNYSGKKTKFVEKSTNILESSTSVIFAEPFVVEYEDEFLGSSNLVE